MGTTIESVRNGVDTAMLFATLDAVKAQPELGTFRFRVENQWLGGAHNRSTIKDFYGAGGEDNSRTSPFEIDAGEPAVLIGTDTGPNPAEYLLHALAACLTTSLVYVAAARGVDLTRVTSRVEGDIDVRGALGLSREVRNGFEQIRVSFAVEGDASDETIRELVERAKARSVVFDIVTNGVPVYVGVEP
ncbi:MAG TPA: OsmC family protein [Gaiellaceae bacterium]|nr:OsmC family protein [Gaiellaceae bacterium]